MMSSRSRSRSRNRNRNRILKSSNRILIASSSKANKKKNSRRKSKKSRRNYDVKRMAVSPCMPMYTRPFVIGFYSPGTEPDCIPYHLYLLVKEAVKSSSLYDLARVEKKINFFCDFLYSHLPLGWKYDRYNATSVIAAGCDPKYNLWGYTPLGDPVEDEFDYKTGLPNDIVFEIMSIVHSRKTPTPDIFMRWGDEYFISFYCKICSCFGIDYQHLEAASEDDVILMNMGSRKGDHSSWKDFLNVSSHNKPYKRRRVLEKISSNEDDDANYNMFKQMRKLRSCDEAFQLSTKQIRDILKIIRTWRLPSQTTFAQWNEYQISFYCKMCSCFGVDYHHLES